MKLTALETEVLEDLRTCRESDTFHVQHEDGSFFEDLGGREMSEDKLYRWVYIDNVIDTTDKSVRGVLGSLEKKGLYMSSDEYAWGFVKLNSN